MCLVVSFCWCYWCWLVLGFVLWVREMGWVWFCGCGGLVGLLFCLGFCCGLGWLGGC